MVHNEAHSKIGTGINTWQNPAPSRDIVDSLVWRNKNGGISWGAYGQKNKYFGAQLLDNGGIGVEVLSVNSFLQDSVVDGNGAADNIGFHLNGYVLPQKPGSPVWVVRNTFKDLKVAGVSFNHGPCSDSSLEKRPVITSGCSSVYMVNMGNTYQNVAKALDFGWQANANTFIKFFDNIVEGNRSPDAVVVRKDQQDVAKQGPISAKLVTGQTFYSSALDAQVTPTASLPQSITYNGLEPVRPGVDKPIDYTFTTARDYPPQVSLQVALNGTQATLKASPTDDKAVTRVEFFVDWIKVGTRTAAPYEVTVDLANLPADGTSLAKRKYAYLYARAFDGIQQIEEYDQRAYSPVVVEVGPEILGPNKPKPVLVNQAPTVDAGVDQTIVLPNSVILNGAVTDDGLPNGETTSTWSKVSGPGTVIFANAKAVDTTATVSASGTYVLRLTASDGALTASDDVAMTVKTAALPETTALNVTIQVVGTPKPGQQATFYVYVQDAAGKEISGATVDLYLDTGDADQEPNHRWTKTSATGGRVTFRVSTNSGDRLPWTLTAVARKGDVQGTGTLTVQ
jgi:hypothetical protein